MAVRVVTITVSDTRTQSDDWAGKALIEELSSFDLVRHAIVADDVASLTEAVQRVVSRREADAIVFAGGTGIAPSDVSYEALAKLFDKHLDGFGEAFRRLSWDEIGPRAILSRAAAGTVGRTVVFLLPGSENAARLGARALVAPILEHAVDLVNGRTKHPRPDEVAQAKPQEIGEGDASRTITVLYFAALRDLVGKDEERISLPTKVATIADLAMLVARNHPLLEGRLTAVRFARNEAFVSEDEAVSAGDVVALIPPVAGG